MAFLRTATIAVWALLLIHDSALAQIQVFPEKVELRDRWERKQLVVTAGATDITRKSAYAVEPATVASVDSAGYLTPRANGQATLVVTYDSKTRSVPIQVTGMDQLRPVDFATEVIPVINRYGCNSGGCHGKASGQNGFKLSLFGADVAFDYNAIVKQARGRRVQLGAPDQSLFLTKATGRLPHGGGRRFDIDTEPYRLLRNWMELGAPQPSATAPVITKLVVFPAERILHPGQQQQLSITAIDSSGGERDVTREATFSSNLDVVASVSEDGFVSSQNQRGEATIMARYLGQVAVFRAIAPHGPELAEVPDWSPINYIDTLAADKWKKLGLRPSPVVDDATFLRRVTIDLCGRLPTADEVRSFLADTQSDKRARRVDQLLESADYPAFFALRWGAILRNSNLAGADQASYAFHNWIKDLIARNRPYDELVRGVVAASGEWQESPAINWYWQSRDDQLHQVTADTAQVFLGQRLQCARCHHHPYERWSQHDYFGLAGFFTRLGRKSFGQPPPYYASATVTSGELNPLTGKTPDPKYLDGETPKFTPEDDPRHGLVDWMAQPNNPFFAKTFVNRMWGHFFGRGLVHEVDDMRETNPPSNPELLDALAKDFIDHRFDMKHIVRTMANSRLYQVSSEPRAENAHDSQNYARFYARRLIAEVFLDAVDQATGTKSRFNGVGSTSRAVDLPHEGFGSYFLDTFDRPRRVTSCECERSSGATLAQVLLLANSDEIENRLADGNGRIAKLVKDQKPIEEMVDELYLASLSRLPRAAERQVGVAYVQSQAQANEKNSNKNEVTQRALEDLAWTLLNTKEFMFNH